MRQVRGYALIIIPLMGVLIFAPGCGGDAQSKTPEEEEQTPAIPVEAAQIREGDISAFFAGTATLEAEEEADVVAKGGGIVKNIFVEEGTYVKVGQILAQLDDERLSVELARAEATLRKLSTLFERNEELYAKQMISSAEYEQSKSDLDAQQAAVDLAKLALAYTSVRAPISGVVSERLIKVGNMVQTYAPTFRITDFDPLLAVMHVPERELNKLRVGQTAQISVDAVPETAFIGHIKRISPVVDPMTGTFKVTVEVMDESHQLMPGMFGRVGIVYDTHPNALLIPKEAVITEDDQSTLFVVKGDTALRTVIKTGYSNARFIEVLDGVALGDLVITTGQANLKDSTRVEIIE